MAEDNDRKPAKWVPKTYKDAVMWDSCQIELIENFETREDDVFVASFPRSGTTLTQVLTYLIMTEDFKASNTVQLDDRFPIMDVIDSENPYFRGVKYLDNLPRDKPRMIKTHIHYFLLPECLRKGRGKIIYVARNPKDVVLSLFKILRHLSVTDMEFDEYLDNFLKGKGMLGDPWWRHVKEYWEHRNDKNILFLKFEEVVENREETIRRIAAFLGKSVSDDLVQNILDESAIDKMKSNDVVNLSYHTKVHKVDDRFAGLINKGIVGGWRANSQKNKTKRLMKWLNAS